ncbi:hypothetical protein KPH14_001276 [Odynerus spinipes]|uniref:Nucleic-acid-binding protein from mobile element jockey n=1 Tax=Odynerus spinipes TaxID=1348599 RepID=A0AAD9VLE5_9HYME|nr:hypothetical protein KPH14_001276 [Odynerus spinipes]
MVLKGLPLMSSDELLAELKVNVHNPTGCSVITPKNSPSKFQIYKVLFPPATSVSSVSKVGHLFNVRVYWEKFLFKRLYTQCFRCQAFGHSANHCNLPERRVKCAGPHSSPLCSKPYDVTPRCAGDHTANYSKCPVLIKYLERRSNAQATPMTTKNPFDTRASNFPPPPSVLQCLNTYAPEARKKSAPRSYADTLKPTPSLSRRQLSVQPTDNNDFNKFNEISAALKRFNSLCDMNLILSTVDTLIARLKPATQMLRNSMLIEMLSLN